MGIADNRDFARLMDPAGLDYRSVTDYREHVFQFVETKFAFVPPSSHRYLSLSLGEAFVKLRRRRFADSGRSSSEL